MASSSEMRALNVPRQEPAHFSRSFIKTVVCEFRFPTLLELETKAPIGFQKAVRKEYPNYTAMKEMSLTPSGTDSPRTVHTFQARNNRWTVSVRQASVSLETAWYDGFPRFADRIKNLLEPISSFIDSDFFTRVGIRYINAVPVPPNELDWISLDLVGALSSGTFGQVSEYWQQIRGMLEGGGGFLLQHGVGAASQKYGVGAASDKKVNYMVDIDMFREDVETRLALDTVRALHSRAFDLFWWTLGEKARSYLEESPTQ